MLGSIDPIDFILAEKLGQPLHVVRSWANGEIAEWRAFIRVQSELRGLHGVR